MVLQFEKNIDTVHKIASVQHVFKAIHKTFKHDKKRYNNKTL